MDDVQSIVEKNIDSYINNKSIIDKGTKHNKSIIDYQTERLRKALGDESLGEGMVALALSKLGEGEIENILNYVQRKATIHKGKAFVRICNNTIKAKG